MVPQYTLGESITTRDTTSETDVARNGISISIYPILKDQWQALQDAAGTQDMDRSELLREAIVHLLDLRDNGEHIAYLAAPRLTAQEKAEIRPRAVWLQPDLFERFRQRCADDRVSQSEFILEALRRYLADRGITLDTPI
jgi:metal-responsive CopG/Arc/MetJ family transcriptional regulator